MQFLSISRSFTRLVLACSAWPYDFAWNTYQEDWLSLGVMVYYLSFFCLQHNISLWSLKLRVFLLLLISIFILTCGMSLVSPQILWWSTSWPYSIGFCKCSLSTFFISAMFEEFLFYLTWPLLFLILLATDHATWSNCHCYGTNWHNKVLVPLMSHLTFWATLDATSNLWGYLVQLARVKI